jgi:exodeoxyribonuclease VII small subunit
MAKERFEDSLNKLEKIVSQLEEGDISLEESLKLFEEGFGFHASVTRNWMKQRREWRSF